MTKPTKPLDLFWFIPVSGDGSYLGTEKGHRPADFEYLKEIAQAVDRLGYRGVLIPTGKGCDDPWITAAALAPLTKELRFLVALRPGVTSPTFAARQAAAIDRISNGRFLVNVVAGGNPAELAGDGVFLGHDERYAHAAEFLTIYRRLLQNETVDFSGKHITVKGAQLNFPPVQAVAAHLVWRFLGAGSRCRGRARRQLPDVGRAARAGGRKAWRRAQAGRGPRPGRQVRNAHSSDRARHRG